MAQTQDRRDPAVAEFLGVLEAAVMACAPEGSEERSAALRAFDCCRRLTGAPSAAAALPQAVCAVLPDALAVARDAGRPALRRVVAGAFAALAPRLQWRPRTSATDPAFRDAHANAMVLGPSGIELRDDVQIGATLMAPGTLYPNHSHPPEEVYLALTPGEWWNTRMDWTDPGPDGLIYNPPGITHAMRSGTAPFLAVWMLPA
ncbi:dimethylsulfonioproprionate lyase family protein [Albidovulum sp.]|jgi:hypothetical protein|uniref:dimethylsulfonioproprionate lyase family protein n=1 Tax=Albidovulum sp. TaxID=1872424 RepID=UPI0030209CC6